MSFGKQLEKALEIRGISQAELCRRSGLKSSYISQYINKPDRDPYLSTAVKIANALNVSLEFLAGEKDTIYFDRTSPKEKELIDGFRRLTLDGQDEIMGQLDCQLSKKKEEVSDHSISEIA